LRLEKAEEIVTKEAELINRRIMPERLEEAILEVINMIPPLSWWRSKGSILGSFANTISLCSLININ